MKGAFLQLFIFTYIPVPFKMFFSVSGKKEPVLFIVKTSPASNSAGMQLHTRYWKPGCHGSVNPSSQGIPDVDTLVWLNLFCWFEPRAGPRPGSSGNLWQLEAVRANWEKPAPVHWCSLSSMAPESYPPICEHFSWGFDRPNWLSGKTLKIQILWPGLWMNTPGLNSRERIRKYLNQKVSDALLTSQEARPIFGFGHFRLCCKHWHEGLGAQRENIFSLLSLNRHIPRRVTIQGLHFQWNVVWEVLEKER